MKKNMPVSEFETAGEYFDVKSIKCQPLTKKNNVDLW